MSSPAPDAVITICQGLRDDLVARGTPSARIVIAPNGVDLGMFGDPLPRDPAFAARLGLGEGPVIGFIGSFYDYEGIDDLIAAMPLLNHDHPDARLLLVGGGPCEEALRQQAAASRAAGQSILPGACRMTKSSAIMRYAISWPIRARRAA